MKLFLKMGYRTPELIARAAMGDLWAVAVLAAMGISAVSYAIKNA